MADNRIDTDIQLYRVNTAIVPMRSSASSRAQCTNECLFGECVYDAPLPAESEDAKLVSVRSLSVSEQAPDEEDVWIHVKAKRDEYTGFVQKRYLQACEPAPSSATHRVRTTSTLVFDEPCIKSRTLHRLPFLARLVCSSPQHNPFHELDTGGFIWREHVSAIAEPLNEGVVTLARTHFMGAPYLWGGCTPQGVDCSGLIQALASAKKLSIPRDSGDQEAALSHDIELSHRQAEDILYWPGHTGLLIDRNTVLHATAHTLSCVIEPLSDVEKRAGAITSVKRLFTP